MSQPLKVFVSYSHKDADPCDELLRQLVPFEDQKLIKVWVDTHTRAAEEWEGHISDNLNSADVTILLLTENFFNSDYCKKIEMERAFERADNGETKVVPILYSECMWEKYPLIHKLKILPPDAKAVIDWPESRASVWKKVMNKFDEVVSSLRQDIDLSRQTLKTTDSLLHYLVNRHAQNEMVKDVLTGAWEMARPVPIIVHGTGRDCLGEYVRVICHHHIPELTGLKRPVEWIKLHIDGDRGIGRDHNWWRALCFNTTGSEDDSDEGRKQATEVIGSRLKENHYLLWIELQASFLGARPEEGLRTIIDFVKSLSIEALKYRLIVAITIDYEVGGGLAGLFNRFNPTTNRISDYLGKLSSAQDEGRKAIVLPAMQTVTQQAVMSWRDKWGSLLSRVPTNENIRNLYSDRSIVTRGGEIRMIDLVERLRVYL